MRRMDLTRGIDASLAEVSVDELSSLLFAAFLPIAMCWLRQQSESDVSH